MFTISHFHPMTVHFPIAIIIVGFIIDLVGIFKQRDTCLTRMGYYLMIIGMIAAIIAFGTGYYFTNELAGEAGVVKDEHKLFATFTLVFIILATMLRVLIAYVKKERSYLKWVVLCLYTCAFIFVIYTGFLGGYLVQGFLIGL